MTHKQHPRGAAKRPRALNNPALGARLQTGITLILVLVFLVSLSLIAAVSMRSVTTGERTVANERDRAIAFQGAESAGREAVAKISASTFPTVGYYPQANPLSQAGNADFWRTTSSRAVDTSCAGTDNTKRFDWTNCATTAVSAYGNSTNPRYVIERLPDVVVSASVTETWYRVTSSAAGGSNQADVILQIMFSP